MQAVRIHEHGDVGIVQCESAPKPKPKIGEVLVQVKAAAMNHLDLWVRRGIPGVPLPMILGSDGSGVIAEIGDDVTQFQDGDNVCIQPLIYCGHCHFCSRGQENYCDKIGILGETQDGTYCEYIAVPEANVRLKPEHISFEEAAAFPLTSQTAYAMLIHLSLIHISEPTRPY